MAQNIVLYTAEYLHQCHGNLERSSACARHPLSHRRNGPVHTQGAAGMLHIYKTNN